MVNLVKRTRRLQELLWIKCGPGALILPKEVSRLSLEFNVKIYGGHLGARRFWRQMLPRIKYRNPSVPISISRHAKADGPSLLHVYTHAPKSAASEPDEPQQPTHTLEMRNLEESEILEALIAQTGAMVVSPTSQELQEMEEMKEVREKSEKDRAMVREHLLAERREAKLLQLAKGKRVV